MPAPVTTTMSATDVLVQVPWVFAAVVVVIGCVLATAWGDELLRK